MYFIRNLFAAFLLFAVLGGAHAATDNASVKVEVETNMGNFTLELYPEKAPVTVENFLSYVDEGFYKNTIFHRVISRFMIQGGGFERDLTQKETKAPITNEANNGLLNETGTIAMARTSNPNSATSQFFINVNDNQMLNYTSPGARTIGYCVFGKVVEGLDVVHKIGVVPTTFSEGYADVPIRPVIIKKMSRVAKAASK